LLLDCFASGSCWWNRVSLEQADSVSHTARWDGSRWVDVGPDHLSAIDCGSDDRCVGLSDGATLVWQADAWTTVAATGTPEVWTLACSQLTSCVGIGPGGTYRWNGTTWSSVAPALPGTLTGVSCVGPTFCLAINSAGAAHRFNGTTWTAVPGGAPADLTGYRGGGPSCAAPTMCQVIGRAPTGHPDLYRPTSSTFNGTSFSAHALITDAVPSASLVDVACPSDTRCVAVGTKASGSDDKAYASVWNGSTWSEVSVPDGSTPARGVTLTSVSCSSPTACLAAGGAASSQLYAFNGTTWSVAPSAGFAPTRVACAPGGSWCAVTDGAQVSVYQAGTFTPRPAPPSTISDLSCPVIGHCVALARTGTFGETVVAATLDGSTWSSASIGPVDGDGPDLGSIDCASAATCRAVGFDSSINTPITAEFAGGTWTVRATAAGGPSARRPTVACGAADRCLSIGDAAGTSAHAQPVAQVATDDWRPALPPPAGALDASVGAVACRPTFCFAVGSSLVDRARVPSVVRWTFGA
jgi:hypothetical protein